MRCIIAIIVQRQSFDAEYVRRLAHSDPETERDFVAYFGELLAIKLRSRLRAPEQIQDVIQETFLRVLKTLRQSGIESPEALGSFVNSVCTNVLFEVYRAQSRVADPVEDRESGEIPADTAMADEKCAPRSAAFSPNFLKKIAKFSAGCFSTSATKATSAGPCKWTVSTCGSWYTVPNNAFEPTIYGGLQRKPAALHHKDEYGASTGTCHQSLGAVPLGRNE